MLPTTEARAPQICSLSNFLKGFVGLLSLVGSGEWSQTERRSIRSLWPKAGLLFNEAFKIGFLFTVPKNTEPARTLLFCYCSLLLLISFGHQIVRWLSSSTEYYYHGLVKGTAYVFGLSTLSPLHSPSLLPPLSSLPFMCEICALEYVCVLEYACILELHIFLCACEFFKYRYIWYYNACSISYHFYWTFKKIYFLTVGERQTDRQRETSYAVPLIYAYIGWRLYAPCLGSNPQPWPIGITL